MSARFDGRSVLVTGAAGGIGLAAARAFAGERARVVLADIDLGRAEAVLFLASGAASYVVGALFSVDGGVAAQ
jgi:NAD(P)-dependent dehydrogenase (short-subunit alcohol dehydrogenase family)